MAVFMLLFSFTCPIRAEHILGGEITYECAGGFTYKFTMKLFRDCAGGGAPFDSEKSAFFVATVSVFLEGQATPFIENFELQEPEINQIEVDDKSPCLDVVEEYCWEEGVYVFEMELPPSNRSYHITYQRCCRSLTTSNILDPLLTGTTISVELKPEAQGLDNVCFNSSPVFNTYPDLLMCANESYEVDAAAVDPDGDRLVYSLCSPLAGAGPEGSARVNGDPHGVNGIAPEPDAAPPYREIAMVPGFTPDKPLGPMSDLSIDPNTGKISVTGNFIGQYVVGVCVEEYRANKLLSVIRRDFQISIVPCEPVVQAKVEFDTIIENVFVLNSCDAALTFNNTSEKEEYISDYYWSFDLDNGPFTSNDKSITLSFPNQGQKYFGQLILNRGKACTDTAQIQVNVKPKISADFNFDFEPCERGPINFMDLSTSGSEVIDEWIWDFGNGDSSLIRHPLYQFQEPGSRNITLLVRDTAGCKARVSKVLDWFPVAEEIILQNEAQILCAPELVQFNNLTSLLNEQYDIEWDFGDGGYSEEISPAYSYEIPGNYSISLDITSPTGCQIGATFDNLFEVRPSPSAAFNFDPKEPSSIEPLVNFSSQSTEAQRLSWYINGQFENNQESFTYIFPDTGYQEILLVAEHQSGCLDSLVQTLDVEPRVNFFLPNAFTPNEDGLNDIFVPVGFFSGINDYHLSIWNRWGIQIFETKNPSTGWNGKLSDGQRAREGVYVVLIRFKEPRGNQREIKEFVTLIK